jgi:aspartate kinase
VGDTQRIKEVARRLVAARQAGRRVVGVLSAMGDTTDELIRLASEMSPHPHPREYDMLVSVGERISNALCAMAIRDLGNEAVSLTGSQAGIVTDTFHGKAKIVEVRARRLHAELDRGQIVLVAGFQGVSTDLEVTTLGRGGSDATAVALAAALGGACEIYTDVEGVFTADPRIVADALKLPRISYEEMLEMAATGARVMMARSVEIARRYGVPIHVRSSFSDRDGTWISEEKDLVLEKAIISGVTHDTSEAKATVLAVPDSPGIAARLFRALADAGVNIDMIVQNVSADGATDISFTLPKTDLPAAEPILEIVAADINAKGVIYDPDIAKISLVGAGMKSHPGVAADMFEALAEAGINIEIISTSAIRVSCVVRAVDVEGAVNAVHQRFRGYAEERVDG